MQEIHNLELYQRVLNLHSDIIALVEENNRLRGENEELGKIVALKQAMQFGEPFYYQEGDETPYCPACWETKNVTVHVTFGVARTNDTLWNCPGCKHMYWVKKNRNPEVSAPIRVVGGSNGWMR